MILFVHLMGKKLQSSLLTIFSFLLGICINFLYYTISFYFKSNTIKNIFKILKIFQGIEVLEIGGPSRFFYKNIPIYQVAKNVDGINFNNVTTWEGNIKTGMSYRYFPKKIGRQYIGEASDFKLKKKYKAIISSNCLEHVANPLKAIENWLDHLYTGGSIFLVLPRKETNFDHKRPVTTFTHLLDDFKKNVDESDLTHLDEIIKLHDYSKDDDNLKIVKKKEIFKNNINFRHMHHHIYDICLLKQIAIFFDCEIIGYGQVKKNNYIIFKK